MCDRELWRLLLLEVVLGILMIFNVIVMKESIAVSKTRQPPPLPMRGGGLRDSVPGVYRQGVYSVGADRLILCKIEKVASRVVLQLGARMDGVKDWHSQQLGDVLAYATTKRAVSTGQLLGRIPKVAMVRDPATRLLSGYISKIESGDWPGASSYAPNAPNVTSSFAQLVGVLEANSDMMRVNRHFRSQHLFCGFQHGVKYDCIIRYEDRASGWKSCLMKLGLWDEFGVSGWGPSSTQAIFVEHEDYLNIDRPKAMTVTVSPNLIQEYYTAELLQRVFKIFEQDYKFFGFQMDMFGVDDTSTVSS